MPRKDDKYEHEYQAHLDYKVFGKWLWSPVFWARNAKQARERYFSRTFNTADRTTRNYKRIVVRRVHD